MPINTTDVTAEELLARRTAILAELGLTLDALTERRRAGVLTSEEWAAWEEIDGINFLLG